MAAQFTKVWAVKTNTRHDDGETITVNLKSGGTKQIKLGGLIARKERKDGSVYYLYASQGDDE